MRDFNFYAPTQVVFGRNSEEEVGKPVKKYGGTKVLVHYGGGSAKRSGLLDKLTGLLRESGIDYVELGGVVPNPLLSKVKEGIDLCRCKFAIMNPERTFTLPPYQTAAGATDIMMHTMERYFTPEQDMTLTDAIAEALLRTVKDSVQEVLKNPEDYRMANR